MKKILSTLACGLALTTAANADFLRAEIGAGAWMQTPKGTTVYNAGANGSDTLDEKQNTSAYVWAFIKHPVPIVPNLRLEYTSISSEGLATGSWGAAGYTISGTSKSTLDLKEIDVIPYYNLLDNTFWITLDVGVDVKIVDLDYKIEPNSSSVPPFSGYELKKTLPIPMGYVRARAQVPVTGLGVEADVKYIGMGSSTFYDARAKLDYTLGFIPVVQPAIEVGYRVQKIKIDDSSVDIKTDIDFAGVYAGIMLRF